MSQTNPNLDSILADKTPSKIASEQPAPKPMVAEVTTPTDTAPTIKAEPEPAPLYTKQPLDPTEYANWLAAGQVYTLIDGLNLSDLAGQISQRHPGINTALYSGSFGEQHSAETPRFVQLDSELHDWLQPQIHENSGWGWSMIPRDQAQRTPEQILNTLCEHYRPWSWATRPKGETWLFRLHDPHVLQNWLLCASEDAIAQFLAPLQHLILLGPTGAQTVTSRIAPLQQSLPLAPWSEATVQTLHAVGKEQLLARLHTHVQTHHADRVPQENAACRGWVLQQANRAYRHGLQDEQSISKYLSLSAVLGADFDQGDTGAWARDILNGPAIQGTEHRIDRLLQAATDRLQAA